MKFHGMFQIPQIFAELQNNGKGGALAVEKEQGWWGGETSCFQSRRFIVRPAFTPLLPQTALSTIWTIPPTAQGTGLPKRMHNIFFLLPLVAYSFCVSYIVKGKDGTVESGVIIRLPECHVHTVAKPFKCHLSTDHVVNKCMLHILILHPSSWH